MRTYDFSPLWRSTVGFDRLFDLAEMAQRAGEDNYPPYNIERTGEDVRNGRDIDSSDFLTDFGFRGVEFGNWVASDERQKSTNLAYEALHDLASTLGIPPRALSLGGQLGLAFGARGSGRAAAHYEPGKLVINLTKLSGAGTLAHEWGHAFDHYFGTLDTDSGTSGADGITKIGTFTVGATEAGATVEYSADGGTNYCGPGKAHVFGTEADAQNAAYVRAWGSKWTRTVLPVDAAGNVIEGGVAWEAARSYEEAERLRAELATWKRTAEQRMERIRSVKAERDDRSARCDAAEADVARLTKERDTARAERDTAKAERDKLTTDEADLRYALRTIAGPLHLRTRPRPCRARRGGCGGVSMGYGIDRGFGYSDSMHGSSASDLAEEVMRARQKFPGRRFLLAALTEEVGELAKAYLQREGDEAVRKEALQVACVAMRIYEEGDETFDDVTAAEAKK